MEGYCVKCKSKREMKDEKKSDNEKWKAGYSGNMQRMWNQNVQDRKIIFLENRTLYLRCNVIFCFII